MSDERRRPRRGAPAADQGRGNRTRPALWEKIILLFTGPRALHYRKNSLSGIKKIIRQPRPEKLLHRKRYVCIIMLKMADQTINLDRLKINGRVYRLARRLIITVEHEDDRLTLSSKEFGLVVSAESLEEGIAGISEELATLWAVYVEEDPTNLTPDALRLRNNLASLVPAGVSL
jgi:hypothetical protein